jgi:hypothetical protein
MMKSSEAGPIETKSKKEYCSKHRLRQKSKNVESNCRPKIGGRFRIHLRDHKDIDRKFHPESNEK